MDFKKVLSASLMIIGIGVALVLIQGILDVVAVVAPANVGPLPLKALLGFVGLGYWLLSFLLFAGLYVWAGMRAVKSYGLDPAGAGAVSALSHTVSCVVSVLVSIVVGMINAGASALTIAGTGSGGAALVGALFGGFWFMVGSAFALAIGAMCLFGGMVLNFGLGYAGALFAEKGKVPSVKPAAEAKPEPAEKKAERK